MESNIFYIATYDDESDPMNPHVFKPGITANIENRMKNHSSDTGAYTNIVAQRAWEMKDAHDIEQRLLRLTKGWATTDRKEWRYGDAIVDYMQVIEDMAIREIPITVEPASIPILEKKTREPKEDFRFSMIDLFPGMIVTNKRNDEEAPVHSDTTIMFRGTEMSTSKAGKIIKGEVGLSNKTTPQGPGEWLYNGTTLAKLREMKGL